MLCYHKLKSTDLNFNSMKSNFIKNICKLKDKKLIRLRVVRGQFFYLQKFQIQPFKFF